MYEVTVQQMYTEVDLVRHFPEQFALLCKVERRNPREMECTQSEAWPIRPQPKTTFTGPCTCSLRRPLRRALSSTVSKSRPSRLRSHHPRVVRRRIPLRIVTGAPRCSEEPGFFI